jgi:class 3 adenylate cyclase/tetratricopeptide (TPR) repeat protein
VAPAVRKTVTVLFCDLVGSTALGERSDPEVLREVMARYHAIVREILERHGGTVEKFVGDAAMAVFGVPQVHEDDAVRAARAAVEIHDAVIGLGLATRIGINTGEVVAESGETLVTGDAVNVAARLEQAAATNEILIGSATTHLLGNSIRTQAVAPLELKGKSERVPAHTLLELVPGVPAFERQIDTPYVGRADELAALQAALRTAVTTRTPQLATIVGAPGIGKSRLAHELIRGSDADVLVGRCISYGTGMTFWPLAEMVGQVGDVRAVLDEDPEGELAASRVAAAFVGADEVASATEIAWGFRKLFEAIARRNPLIVVVDDIHWAETTLLDLIEYVVTVATDAPLLVLCMARPDLFDVRPDWSTPKPNSKLLALAPLATAETKELIEALGEIDEENRARVISAAEGNPLFVEQLVAMQAESTNGELEVPPTLQALLSARIDSLDPGERAVVERASVEGRLFHRGAVSELVPEQTRPNVGSHLLALVRKEFVRPDRATIPGDDAFRFAHVLIRDAVYDSLPKRVRAELHELFADWLQTKLRAEAVDEILAYHLEQAFRYLEELGAVDAEASTLAARAAAYLDSAGERAFARDDLPAAINLFERALALPWPDPNGRRIHLGLRLASALIDVGRPWEADEAAQAAAACGAAIRDRAWELRAELFRGQVLMWTSEDYAPLVPVAEAAIRHFEEVGDDRGVIEAWRVLGAAALVAGRHAEATEALERGIECAQRSGAAVEERELLGWLQYNFFNGPNPVKEILRWREEKEFHPGVSVIEAALLSMDGQIAQAREICTRASARLQELGMLLWEIALTEFGWEVEMQAGDYAAAERYARRGFQLYGEMKSNIGVALSGGMLADALYEQGRYDEAAEWAEISEQNVPSNEIGPGGTRNRWREVQAKVLAQRGNFERAEQLAREAVAVTERTDSTGSQADAQLALAEVLALAGRNEDASTASSNAAELYERKGIVPKAKRARDLLTRTSSILHHESAELS